ncbi:ATP synthase subunit I [Moraxella lacunata]|uniref:ATP synthase subunit I n=1 Tax=Moraxella lacunata TaxID=477 RepID=UPI003EDFBB38
MILIGLGFILEILGIAHATKSMALGGLLGYIAQCAFTLIAYRTTGARAGRVIMLNMYLGQMIKWFITLMGFALIFMLAKPIGAFLVILAYFALQVVHILVMWRI